MRDSAAPLRSALFAGLFALAVLFFGCGGDETTTVTETKTETTTATKTETTTTQPGSGDDNAGADDGDPVPTRNCGDVAFQPNSDAGAFDIRATGVACEAARSVAADAEGAGRSYESGGFSCSGTPGGGALATVEFTCTMGDARITFSAS